jgi:hypothetical protein
VKGHQDTPANSCRIPFEKLSFAAQLNCHADDLATAQYTCTKCTSQREFCPPPEAQAYIVIAARLSPHTFHGQCSPHVVGQISEKQFLRETIFKQTGWEPAMFDWVDWRSLQRSHAPSMASFLSAAVHY